MGLCDINVVADPDNTVLETNELNNALFPVGFGIQLNVMPSLSDLSPIALEYPATPVSPGANVSMLARITNTAGAFFTPFAVRFSICRFDTDQQSL